MTRRIAITAAFGALALFLGAASVQAASVTASVPALAAIDATVEAGDLDPDLALLYKFYYVFEPEMLPADYRADGFAPVKCVTPLIREFEERRATVNAGVARQIDVYLAEETAPADAKATYVSPGGHFQFTYLTSGTNAVPTTDVDPANGVPDFVDRCAEYMDHSWSFEIDTLGFAAPPTSPYYAVSFESMQAYGYTTVVSGTSTRIVLHNDFQGFPANDDPEGNVWGAAKVTCAHEFKHASQIVHSNWSEGGWVEVDATWMEDIAYDQVNDYYNYIVSGSPISAPSTSLDSGGTGSYEDCIWQHWMSETWGNQIIVDFWTYRQTHTGENVLVSYDTILQDNGSSIADGYAVFGGWNYATNSRALPGIGYGEAPGYPLGPLTSSVSSYPAVRTGTLAKLATNFVRCTGFSGSVGSVTVLFDGDDAATMGLVAVIERDDGTALLETIALDGNNDADVALSVPLEDVASVGFIVANSAIVVGNAAWSLTVDDVPYVPAPLLQAAPTALAATVVADGSDTAPLTIENVGVAGSSLSFEIIPMDIDPIVAPRSVLGSTVTASITEYTPGVTMDVDLVVTNNSPDDEWLTDVTIDFPAGVTVNSTGNFVGGQYGDLITDGATGDGVLVHWHGDTGDPNYYGVITGGGQQAVATANLSFAAGLSSTILLTYTIDGDLYGSTPHSYSSSLALPMSSPTVEVTTPNGGELLAAGDLVALTWTATQMTSVKVELSRDAGSTWEVLAADTPNDGSLDWTVSGASSGLCRLRVGSLDGGVQDASDANFVIYGPVAWLSAAPAAGAVPEGSSTPVTVTFDATGLTPGGFTAWLYIDNDGTGGPVTVPAGMTVTDPGTGVGDAPAAFAVRGNAPNPFNPRTRISFTLERDGAARVDVLDLQGRVVRRLLDRTLTAGPQTVEWDGRDGAGRPLASGAYLVRLRSGGQIATHKMVLAR